MSSVDRYRRKAREQEEDQNWSGAIDLYGQAISAARKDGLSPDDVGLFNRIGDLYLKLDDTYRAVSHYLEAVDLYAQEGLESAAIALCQKILRVAPDQVDAYRKLAKLHVSTGLMADARSEFDRYLSGVWETEEFESAVPGLDDLAASLMDGSFDAETFRGLCDDGEYRTAFDFVCDCWADSSRPEESGTRTGLEDAIVDATGGSEEEQSGDDPGVGDAVAEPSASGEAAGDAGGGSPAGAEAIPTVDEEGEEDDEDDLRATDAARRLAGEYGIDLELVSGSGQRGRIVKADVEAAFVRGLDSSEINSTVDSRPAPDRYDAEAADEAPEPDATPTETGAEADAVAAATSPEAEADVDEPETTRAEPAAAEADAPAPDTDDGLAPDSAEEVRPPATSEPVAAPEVRATDAAERLAAEHDVDLAALEGSGVQGRVLEGDVESALAPDEPQRDTEPERDTGPEELAVAAEAGGDSPQGDEPEIGEEPGAARGPVDAGTAATAGTGAGTGAEAEAERDEEPGSGQAESAEEGSDATQAAEATDAVDVELDVDLSALPLPDPPEEQMPPVSPEDFLLPGPPSGAPGGPDGRDAGRERRTEPAPSDPPTPVSPDVASVDEAPAEPDEVLVALASATAELIEVCRTAPPSQKPLEELVLPVVAPSEEGPVVVHDVDEAGRRVDGTGRKPEPEPVVLDLAGALPTLLEDEAAEWRVLAPVDAAAVPPQPEPEPVVLDLAGALPALLTDEAAEWRILGPVDRAPVPPPIEPEPEPPGEEPEPEAAAPAPAAEAEQGAAPSVPAADVQVEAEEPDAPPPEPAADEPDPTSEPSPADLEPAARADVESTERDDADEPPIVQPRIGSPDLTRILDDVGWPGTRNGDDGEDDANSGASTAAPARGGGNGTGAPDGQGNGESPPVRDGPTPRALAPWKDPSERLTREDVADGASAGGDDSGEGVDRDSRIPDFTGLLERVGWLQEDDRA